MEGLFGLAALGAGSSLFNTVMSAGLSSSQAKRQYNYQRLLNQQAYDLTQQGYREMYGNLRYGLESAGYNPILATGFGTGGNFSSGSAALAHPVSTSDIADSVGNAYRLYKLENSRVNAEVENLDANTKNVNAKTVTEGYNQQLLQSQYLLNQINTELSKKDLSWKDRMYLMQEKTGYIQAAAAHLGAEAQQLNANTAKQHLMIDSELNNIKKYMAKTERYVYRLNKFNSENDYYKNYKDIRFGQDMSYMHKYYPVQYYGNFGNQYYYGRKSFGY